MFASVFHPHVFFFLYFLFKGFCVCVRVCVCIFKHFSCNTFKIDPIFQRSFGFIFDSVLQIVRNRCFQLYLNCDLCVCSRASLVLVSVSMSKALMFSKDISGLYVSQSWHFVNMTPGSWISYGSWVHMHCYRVVSKAVGNKVGEIYIYIQNLNLPHLARAM